MKSMDITRRVDKQILFVDMNSFFASCEQAENPALRHKPIAVIPTENSCALSASYEAKSFGIHTGMPEREARFLCPNLITVRARPKLYMDYHRRFIAILEHISPQITVRSVDEASILLCRNEEPLELARTIKQAIWQQLGSTVHCSIGIAPNVFLAKLATELQKPNGLVTIGLADLPTIYHRVQLRDLSGINYAMERRLNRIGIYSPLDFYLAKADLLRHIFGIVGYRWWLRLHGYETHESLASGKSLSHSHVLPPQYRTPKQAYTTFQRLIAKVGRRLRKSGYMTGRISLIIRFVNRTYTVQSLRTTPCSDTLTLIQHGQRLWRKANPQTPIMKIAVWTTNLMAAAGIPLPLFPKQRHYRQLSEALDKVNDRYGADTIRFAVLDTNGSRTPDRISFNALFDIEHE